MADPKDIDFDETARLLKTVAEHFDKEDMIVRQFQLRRMRRLKLYWNSFSQIYWSEAAQDYRIAGFDDIAASDTDQDYYDKPVNVFRAFLETLIAALSIQIPAVACVPDDAENPNDLVTAKAGDKIAELLYKHNDVVFLWLHALYIHCTEGLVACYTYENEDESYGTYEEKQYKDEKVLSHVCPNCQAQLAEELFQKLQQPQNQQQQQEQNPSPQDPQPKQPDIQAQDQQITDAEKDEFAPDDDDVEIQNLILNDDAIICPECAEELDPELQKTELIIPRIVGITSKPKSRICMEMYGGLYVKVANYAKTQKETPYLDWSYETHYVNAFECYPHLRKNLPQGGMSNTGTPDPYAQYARINPQYRNAYPEEQVTVKNTWLRPSSFNILPEEQYKELKRKFPNGAKLVRVNDIVADYENESLDDCWTLTQNPVHDFLNHDPLGELLVNIQDITNDLISLVLQTIEHGIAQTWVDPSVVNVDAQGQVEAQPGLITATKPVAGVKNISEAFYSTTLATLHPEVFQFYQIIQQLGQFVSGALPSVFGGMQDSTSSGTAAEYAMSRSMALQRLQTPWKMFTIFWKNIFGKAIPSYMKMLNYDERYVQKDEQGNFTNVFIRRSELVGKIGSVELEASEQLPVTDQQKADTIMKLMELNNSEIIQALASPENLPFIRKIVRLPEFVLPGEADRQKQLEEIQLLLQSEPITIQPDPIQIQMAAQKGLPPPQPQELPTVQVDPIVDNNQVEGEICRNWLVSEAGRLAKIENPSGYKNVLLHMKQHMDLAAQAMMQQMQQQAMMSAQNQNKRPVGTKGTKAPKKPNGQDTNSINPANAGIGAVNNGVQ